MSAPKNHLVIDNISQSINGNASTVTKLFSERTPGSSGMLLHNSGESSDLMFKATNRNASAPEITSLLKTGAVSPGETIPLYFGDNIDVYVLGSSYVAEEI